ncbi:MAG TPA: hypothetical protein VH678_20490 [Xanthobacteraceae bacterium]|jgi:hypothetical protein
MTELTHGAQPEREQYSIVSLPESAPDQFSISEAARRLQSARYRDDETPAEAPTEAAELQSPAQAEDGAPQDTQVPAETTTESQAEPEEIHPPIEPPRSWNAGEKERFRSLPRETQAYLAEREQERDREIRRSQNQAAEKLKGLSVKEQAVEQARQQYEAALPQLLQLLQSQQAGEFANIKSIADVERLAREDWPSYLQWDVAQKKIAAVQQEMQAAQQRQAQDRVQKFTEFAKREDDLFAERVPDMADPEKATKLQQQAISVLKDVGFTEAELAGSWNGDKDLSLRDHRMQLLIRDATLWREAQQKATQALKKPVPPVQRPGLTAVKNAGREAEIQNLNKQLANASGLNATRVAAQLVAARRRNSR